MLTRQGIWWWTHIWPRPGGEGDGWSGSGANPWHLDATTDSVLFLTNESNQPARVGLSITAENVHYYLTSLELAPYETRAIDIRQLRDAQVADFKGNVIPANATDGSVNWVRIDDVPMSGRLLVIRRGQGTVSSYDCCSCVCPLSFTTVTVTPSPSFDTLAGGTTACTCTAEYYSCNSTPYYYDETVGASWGSSDTSVATMDGSVNGQVDAVAAGSATIQAAYSGDQWYYYSPQARCVSNLIHATGSNTANVDSLVFTITSGGAPNDPNGVVARQPFNLKIQAKSPTGVVPDTGFNDANVSFSLQNINTSVGESAPSSVNFSSGSTSASVTAVQASGLTNSTRTIVVSANATGTVFFFQVYMNVFATDEGNVGGKTACGYIIPANAQIVALPYSGNPDPLCGVQVLVENGTAQQQVPVEDAGPWCPHSVATTSNPCVCANDNCWQGTAVPYAATNPCSSNGAGIDLGDGTYSTVRGGTNGPVDWKFP